MKNITPQQLQHEPVLLEQVLAYLAPNAGESYLDLTAGYGGHAQAIINRVGAPHNATLVDRDEMAITALQPLHEQGAVLLRSDFLHAAYSLQKEGKRFDMILADLGVSSPQFDIAERGFSLRTEGPLDMRMDARQATTAATLVNESKKDTLVRLIRRYGEEPRARRIVEALIAARPIYTTTELRDCIMRSLPGHQSKDATVRTFQALRIAVNAELEQIQALLPIIPDLLRPGGRVAIISFHSLEDRLVKRYFHGEASNGYEARLHLLTKKPVQGSTHDVHNPRARSAKLRAAVKINTPKERT